MNLLSALDLHTVKSLKQQVWPSKSIGNLIEVYDVDQMIREDAPHLVLISPGFQENDFFIYGVREQLYSLFTPSEHLRIADSGSFCGNENDFFKAIGKIREYGSIPIVISSHQSHTFYLYKSFFEDEQSVNICSVDPFPDLSTEAYEENENHSWLTKIISHQPNFLFNYSLIAFQTYLSDPEMLKTLEDMNFDLHRLGRVREFMEGCEPILRNADILSFDVSAIRSSDFPASENLEPNGLYAEEACRILRYSGLSNRLNAAIISGWSVSRKNDTDSSEKLVAQLIWHLADGIIARSPDGLIGNSDDYTIYNISLENIQEEIIFFKNKKNGKWWMKVPMKSGLKSSKKRFHLIPCHIKDYQQAMQGELPESWWQTYKKLI